MLKLVIGGVDPATSLETHEWHADDGTFGALGHVLNGEEWWLLPGVASFSIDRGDDVRARPALPARPDVILDAYHRIVLPMAMQARGYEVLHASAVRTTHGVVVLCGASGAGKSTIGYALSRRGYAQWGDDVVVFEASGPSTVCLQLPFRVRLLPDAVSFFGDGQGTTRAFSNENGDEVGGKPAPLAAMFILERAADVGANLPIQAGRLSPASAFPRVLAHAHCLSFGDVGRKRRMIQHYLKLVSLVPTFEIRFGTGLKGLSAIIDVIIQAVDAPKTAMGRSLDRVSPERI